MLAVLMADSPPRSMVAERTRMASDPGERCIHQLFEEQVQRTPAAIAVVQGHIELSYAELNATANRVAHRLIALGVAPDSRVALCVERRPALVIGLLAILKAGGGYVPLDPSYPTERLQELVRDAEPVLVLGDAVGLQALGDLRGAIPLLALDELGVPGPLGEDADDPVVAGLTSAHLAYVIYTSGSTGKPKGVMVEHAQIVRLLESTRAWYGFNGHDVWCLFHSFAFDFSVWELWGALRYGGRLVIVPREVARSAPAFHRLVCAAGVTVLNQTPSAFNAFIDAHAASGVRTRLRYVILGGETVDLSLVKRWHDACRSNDVPQLVNIYGPTETTVFVTCTRITPADQVVGIGCPIEGTYVKLLDEDRRPVLWGAVGELFVGGSGVARGYLNRPELTAEKFVRDTSSEDPAARMYRTGDLARYLPDGSLEFVGRDDHQVKLRGYRIELGEIEARLTEHQMVREAAVIAREDTAGDRRLVAYVVTTGGDMSSIEVAATLREHLGAKLPAYMVPAAFVRLDALPLTQNGKLDRRALPVPDREAVVQRAYDAPRGEIERTLAAHFEQLLEVQRVGRNDDFFELGGHSLLAVRLINRLSEILDVDMRMTSVFEHPTVEGLARAIADLHNTSSVRELPPITRAPRDMPIALSHAQQRLWFLSQLEGVSESYHIVMSVRLRGALDRTALRRSVDALMARHEALRSVFVADDGRPHVELLPASCGFSLSEHDAVDDAGAELRLEQLIEEEARARFELSRGPLVRGRLIRLGSHEHVLVLVQHHIISDGWSLGLLTRELSSLYRVFSAGEDDPLPPMAIQYPDYAAWERQWLTAERLRAHRDYWRRTLTDAPETLELPTTRRRPPQQSFTGAAVGVHIDAELTSALKRLSQQQGTTLFMTLLAAWASVLARLSGQDDIVIGVPSANRARREVEGLLGFFVNTLALRIDLSGQPSAAELLARVRRAALTAQDHQDLPFEQVVEIVRPQRRLDQTPLFQVMFAWQSNDVGGLELPGLEVEPVDAAPRMAKFDLELNLSEIDGCIAGELVYAETLFDADSVARYRGYLLAMLSAMVVDPLRPLVRVELLARSERELLLKTWNQTDARYPSDRCVHQLFEEQVQRTPTAIAVRHGEVELTYSELDGAANQLAHRLIALGVKPGDCVATLFDRSLRLVVAQLAILKAGAVYVPLDPEAPWARHAWLIADCAARVVVTDAERTLPSDVSVPVLHIEPITAIAAGTSGAFPVVSGESPAYVMYTSGSTGTPKGVVVLHRAISRLVIHNGYAEFEATHRIAWVGNPAFDISTLEVWAPLLHGACLVVISRDELLEPNTLRSVIQQQAINVLHLTAGLFHQVADVLGSALTQLRLLLVGGDVVDPTVMYRVIHRYRPRRVLHCYGPTESTTFATTYEVTDVDPASRLPIGRPIANTRVYVLDGHRQLVPLGVAGELYVGGAGVARGYLNRPDLTADKFVRDPFSDDPDARMYRTGDQVRYLPDGNLDFLGRNDQQVKLRGYRIEPGEIEARLTEYSTVREAAVVVHEDTPGDKRLVAYVATSDWNTSTTELAATLREHLSAKLPPYMVPATFVRLDTLPLTPNGKLDRRALPPPGREAAGQRAYEAPQGEMEQKVAAIWEDVLGIQGVGRHDNFFELGGHSLSAVRLVSRLQSELKTSVEVSAVFASPVLSSFARKVLIASLANFDPDELRNLISAQLRIDER
jgi:amino acid adenylation domain-containing protein